jgi:hypothetical protein
MLPNKPRGVRVHMILVCSMASCRSCVRERRGAILPENFGPYACCNRLVRWRGDKFIKALAAAHDGAVQTIDTFVVRVRQHGACIAGATCS